MLICANTGFTESVHLFLTDGEYQAKVSLNYLFKEIDRVIEEFQITEIGLKCFPVEEKDIEEYIVNFYPDIKILKGEELNGILD